MLYSSLSLSSRLAHPNLREMHQELSGSINRRCHRGRRRCSCWPRLDFPGGRFFEHSSMQTDQRQANVSGGTGASGPNHFAVWSACTANQHESWRRAVKPGLLGIPSFLCATVGQSREKVQVGYSVNFHSLNTSLLSLLAVRRRLSKSHESIIPLAVRLLYDYLSDRPSPV